jgi:hypothetical protein
VATHRGSAIETPARSVRFRVRLRYADTLWVNRLWQRGRGRRCATIRRKPYLEYHAAIPAGMAGFAEQHGKRPAVSGSHSSLRGKSSVWRRS